VSEKVVEEILMPLSGQDAVREE